MVGIGEKEWAGNRCLYEIKHDSGHCLTETKRITCSFFAIPEGIHGSSHEFCTI